MNNRKVVTARVVVAVIEYVQAPSQVRFDQLVSAVREYEMAATEAVADAVEDEE